ncbi:MAG TPA: DNA gyrase subunit B [Pirellulaceae bacterium]|jgi:DNA gyrase subunit B|nr:DNA gyrase subunit B [Pirellulaceae bacterium]
MADDQDPQIQNPEVPSADGAGGTPEGDAATANADAATPQGEAAPANGGGRKKANEAYEGKDLEHLSDWEHVRKRPSMYIGDTGARGLHHLVYEVVDNSVDEAMAGFASEVSVRINKDNSVTVEDNGRGIPTDVHEQLTQQQGREVSTLEGVMTVLKFGGKFNKGAYQTSGGLHGVGVTVVNFLSEWAEVEVAREGKLYRQEYERGIPTGPIEQSGKSTGRGTKTTFKPDAQIFSVTKFAYDTLHKRLQDLAFLNRGVRIKFFDERNDQGDEFYYERGIVEYVEWLNRASDPLHPDVLSLEGEQEGVGYEVALQYSDEYTESLHSYVNNIHTTEGGTHVSGFRSGLTRALSNYAKKSNLLKDLSPSGEDFREGLTVVISLRVPEPKFEGQTKTKLGNSEVEGILSSATYEFLTKYLEEHPKTATSMIRKGILAAEAREAARRARELVQKRKSAFGGGSLPGKLRDCISREAHRCELYLVEGDSAGGSAEGGRLRDFQAILPLRGKIINAYKAREDKVLANEEVQSMIMAIGAGVGSDMDLSKLRYHKIIIMTDADIDGSHIRTLLLCFFYRQMYEMVAKGHVYVAQPPLYRVVEKKRTYYVQEEEQMRTQLLERGLEDAVFDPKRADGRTFAGDDLRRLCELTAELEEEIQTLERRGISLKAHATRYDEATLRLPVFLLSYGKNEKWFFTRAELEEFKATLESPAAPAPAPETTDGDPATQASQPHDELTIDRTTTLEFHEVRTINQRLKDLNELGFDVQALITQVRTGDIEPRYVLRRDGSDKGLEDLRELLDAVLSEGKKGMSLTRFKGLGEMNAEELRDTTLDPAYRRLVKVTMADVAAADEIFRILMGEKVEPRREFIEKHALEVQNLDV